MNHGFVTAPPYRTFTSFDAPGAGTASGQGTFPATPNLFGAITGQYIDDKQCALRLPAEPVSVVWVNSHQQLTADSATPGRREPGCQFGGGRGVVSLPLPTSTRCFLPAPTSLQPWLTRSTPITAIRASSSTIAGLSKATLFVAI